MIQLQVINYILSTGDASFLLVNNLTDEYFCDYKDEFNFILRHLQQYGNIPDQLTFLAEFDSFDIVKVNEPPAFLLDQLYKDRNRRILVETFNEMRKYLNENNIEDAISLYTKTSDQLSKLTHISYTDILRDTSRYHRYLEKCKDYSKFYIKTGFNELDSLIGGWDKNEELVTLSARSGVGKCLEKGTKILMADGSTKAVEDVKVGDKVQSLGRVNTVLGLHSGKSKGYRIIPSLGDPFVVSENHILTLMRRNTVLKKGDILHTTDNSFELCDIMIEDYLNLSKNNQRFYNLYRPKIDYPTKDLRIPPYILGLWLGDGTSCRVSLTSIDPEIINEWKNWGYQFTDIIREDTNTYDITNYKNRGKTSEVLELFRSYNLINNKHIPLDYLTSDREQRLELLAGIIDTDGYLSRRYRKASNTYNSCYSLCLKSKLLIEQIAQLARGLNFRVGKIKERQINNKVKGLTSYYTISITGKDIADIPCRLSKKKAIRSSSARDMNMCAFKIEPVDMIEYYGFMADGDHRYLLADNTLTHNTWMLLKCAVSAAEQGLNVGIYSGEMSTDKVAYRIDTLISHISNTSIVRGNSEIQNTYKQHLDSIKDKIKGSIKVMTPQDLGNIASITALQAFIDKEHLDMLCVDQHSLLEDIRKGKTPVERASNISKDLKNLQVLKKIPIIAVSQQNRTAAENGAGTEHIAQSDRIAQDSTIIIFFEQKDNILTLNLAKSRDSVSNKKLHYIVDFDKGLLTYIPENADENINAQLHSEYDEDEKDVF